MPHLPEEVVETIINKLTANGDRNSASLVNKLWYSVDRNSRRIVYVSDCHAISPARVIERFPNLRSLTLKGKRKPGPNNRIGSIDPWIEAMFQNCPLLEKLRLKRMVVSDENLSTIAICFRNFKSLILNSCFGFTIAGLSAVASNCSKLEQLEVESCDVTDNTGEWLNRFPETLSSLVSLNISCIKGPVNPIDLQRLVARSPKLTSLSLSRSVPGNTIRNILRNSPQLVHLGVGSTLHSLEVLSLSLYKCQAIQSLAFFYLIPRWLLRAIYPVCPNLVSVNMRFCVVFQSNEQVNFLKNCTNLRRLWVQGCIGDEGLKVVSSSCKELEHLRVYGGTGVSSVTEVGLIAISRGCQKLKSLTYCCNQMTNAALITFSENCPNLTCFKLIISPPEQPDYTTLQALDHGFGAIVKSCKILKKLTISGLLTDDVFLYIGMYAERLQVLCVYNAGENDTGKHYVINGCKNLKKVETGKRSFDDDALLASIYQL